MKISFFFWLYANFSTKNHEITKKIVVKNYKGTFLVKKVLEKNFREKNLVKTIFGKRFWKNLENFFLDIFGKKISEKVFGWKKISEKKCLEIFFWNS